MTRAERKTQEFAAARAAELHDAADRGVFHLGPGHVPPTSYDEAHAQADFLVGQEAEQVRHRLRGRHTLFFVPMQYWAFVGAVLAVLSVPASLV